MTKVTGIKCEHDKNFLSNFTCTLKAVKGKRGIITVMMTPVKALSDIKMHFKLFYKFGNAIYRPWMINFEKVSNEYSINFETNCFVECRPILNP